MESWSNASNATNRTAPDNVGELLQFYRTSKGIGLLTTLSTLSLIGIVGNSVALSIFRSRLKAASRLTYRNHYNFFTFALAASDLFVCVWRMPHEVVLTFKLITNDIVCKATGGLSQISVSFATIIHIGLCIERYYAVCKPRCPFSIQRIRFAIGTMGIMSFILSTPSLWIYSVYDGFKQSDNVGCHRRRGLPVGWYYNLALAILMSLSVIVVLSMYSLMFRSILARVLKKAAEPSHEPTAAGTTTLCESRSVKSKTAKLGCCLEFKRKLSSTSKIAIMFFAVTIVFYISWIPYFIVSLDIADHDVFLENAHFITSSINFMVYVAFNGRIRKEAIAKLSLKKSGRPVHSTSVEISGGSSNLKEVSNKRAASKTTEKEGLDKKKAVWESAIIVY